MIIYDIFEALVQESSFRFDDSRIDEIHTSLCALIGSDTNIELFFYQQIQESKEIWMEISFVHGNLIYDCEFSQSQTIIARFPLSKITKIKESYGTRITEGYNVNISFNEGEYVYYNSFGKISLTLRSYIAELAARIESL